MEGRNAGREGWRMREIVRRRWMDRESWMGKRGGKAGDGGRDGESPSTEKLEPNRKRTLREINRERE